MDLLVYFREIKWRSDSGNRSVGVAQVLPCIWKMIAIEAMACGVTFRSNMRADAMQKRWHCCSLSSKMSRPSALSVFKSSSPFFLP